MAIRDSMRDSAARFLEPGEQVQAVLGAQTHSPLLNFLSTSVFAGMTKYRIVVVTDRRILVLDTGHQTLKKARGVVTELPRVTRLGPGTGLWHKIETGPETLRVHRRFFKDIAMVDRMESTVSS